MADDTTKSDTVPYDETSGQHRRRQRREPDSLDNYRGFNFPDVFAEDVDLPETGAKPLTQLAEEYLLEQLSETVMSTTNYSCGGSLPVSQTVPTSAPQSSKIDKILAPFSICWDLPGTDYSRKIQFPIVSDVSSPGQTHVSRSPFLDILDVYDIQDPNSDPVSTIAQLPKCAMLNPQQFSTNFDPTSCGILDSIAQTLLPNFQSARLKGRVEHQGAIAELRGLTIYERVTESIEVDADSSHGFSSLLVFLSYNAKGGTLKTSHKDSSIVFDWSGQSKSKYQVQWVGFQHGSKAWIPGCQSGAVAFLKYTVRIVERTGLTLLHKPVSDLTQLPLFRKVKALLDQPAFLSEGGTLAYCCVYDYQHALGKTKHSIYHSLKGIDGIVLTTFRKLGLEVKVRPMLYPGSTAPGEDLLEYGTTIVGTDFHSSTPQVFNYHEPYEWPPPKHLALDERFRKHWPFERVADLIWLTKQHNSYTSGLVCLSQIPIQRGQEAYPEAWWSNVAILVKIPSRG